MELYDLFLALALVGCTLAVPQRSSAANGGLVTTTLQATEASPPWWHINTRRLSCSDDRFRQNVQATCWFTTENDQVDKGLRKSTKTGFCCTKTRNISPRGVWFGLTIPSEDNKPEENQMSLCADAGVRECEVVGKSQWRKCDKDEECASDGQIGGGCSFGQLGCNSKTRGANEVWDACYKSNIKRMSSDAARDTPTCYSD